MARSVEQDEVVPLSLAESAPIDSPCIGVCSLDARGLCQGCARTMDEISRWLEMSAAQRERVMTLIAERRASARGRA